MKTAAAYKTFEDKRDSFTRNVLASTASKKLVMAGPGTGKSFLFQQVARDLIDSGKKDIIVLSFINELVNDLGIDMHGLAQVQTLHSFAARQLAAKSLIYMRLLSVIETDLRIEIGTTSDLAQIIHSLKDDASSVGYLDARRSYYDAFDPASIVFELVRKFESYPASIPVFDLVLVDEYQDFNLLEARLIEQLATKSNILIAGDDDQSLYSFKHAEPESIRSKHGSTDYENFELPYCSRSTEVVIDSFHDVVKEATSAGHLSQRVDKQYLYFPCEKKDHTSAKHQKITVRTGLYNTQVAHYIDAEIKEQFKTESKFDVLVVCSLKNQVAPLVKALKKRGYVNTSSREQETVDSGSLIDGLRLLLTDKESNLGWRLCAEGLLNASSLEAAIKASAGRSKPFSDYISKECKTTIRKLRAICSKIKDEKAITEAERNQLLSAVGINAEDILDQRLRSAFPDPGRPSGPHTNTKIRVTTILGSKGLSYDHVFLVNFDDKYLIPKSGIDDESINKFLVALTRSKTKINIFTSQSKVPVFVGWIDDSRKQVKSVAGR